jgi:hypothetical protein
MLGTVPASSCLSALMGEFGFPRRFDELRTFSPIVEDSALVEGDGKEEMFDVDR